MSASIFIHMCAMVCESTYDIMTVHSLLSVCSSVYLCCFHLKVGLQVCRLNVLCGITAQRVPAVMKLHTVCVCVCTELHINESAQQTFTV